MEEKFAWIDLLLQRITDDAAACVAAADEDVADATLLIDTLKSNATR